MSTLKKPIVVENILAMLRPYCDAMPGAYWAMVWDLFMNIGIKDSNWVRRPEFENVLRDFLCTKPLKDLQSFLTKLNSTITTIKGDQPKRIDISAEDL